MLQFNRRQKRRLMGEINVVPYIDVMLVLLIIFMVTAPLLNQGVNVNLPYTKARALASEQTPIIVSVNARGQYFLNVATKPQQAINNVELVEKVQGVLVEAKRKGIQRMVLIKGDKNVAYGSVVSAMVLLQQAGVQNVGLMTQDVK